MCMQITVHQDSISVIMATLSFSYLHEVYYSIRALFAFCCNAEIIGNMLHVHYREMSVVQELLVHSNQACEYVLRLFKHNLHGCIPELSEWYKGEKV